MRTAPTQLSTSELEQGLADITSSPRDEGRLEAIFVRPDTNERRSLPNANLSPAHGIEGDRWRTNHWKQLDDGSSDPNSQVSLMNVRVLRHVAGTEVAMEFAGDNLIVDFDLSEANLPAGSQIQIGDAVVLEITAEKHSGCHKFAKRYGAEARAFVNSADGKKFHLRGRYAKILQAGTVQVGATVRKVE
jgi:hypothetical protein